MNRFLRNILKNVYVGGFGVINTFYYPLYSFLNKKCICKTKHLVDSLKGDKVLVLAPHVDDDMIGCGGAIINYLKNNKQIHIAYLTNGAKQGSFENKDFIISERRQEAINVANVLNINNNNLYFLNSEDGNLVNQAMSDELFTIISNIKPDVIFLPVLLDSHLDHYAVTKKLYEVYEKYPNAFDGIELYLYEVQSPFTTNNSNVHLDISETLEQKKELLKQYASQPSDFSFVGSLAKINGVCFGKKIYCENYIYTSPSRYFKFYIKYFKDINKYLQIKTKLVGHGHNGTLIRSYESSMKEKQILKELH